MTVKTQAEELLELTSYNPKEIAIIVRSAKALEQQQRALQLAEEAVFAACRYRNIHRGWRAEDKTKELPDETLDESIEEYSSELRLKLFELCDAYEATKVQK